MTSDQLTLTEVAEVAGVKYGTVIRWRCRTSLHPPFPTPDGYMGRTPWWYRSTIEDWVAARTRAPDS